MQTKLLGTIIFMLSLVSAEEHTLSLLCKHAVENSPKIKSFAHRTAASHSYYKQQTDRYKPQITIDGNVGYQDYDYDTINGVVPYQGYTYNYSLTLKQSIYSATLLHSMTDAQEKEKLGKLQEDDEKARLITQILQSSFELARLQMSIDILSKKEKLLEKAHKNIQKKYRLKLASQVDHYQALSRFQQSRSDLTKAKQMYSHNLFNLRLLTKLEKVESYINNINFNIKVIRGNFNKTTYPIIKNDIKNNTRIKLDAQTVEIAKVQIDLRKSERYPKLDAVISYGDVGGTIDQLTRQNDSRAMVMLNFPIFQGGYVSDRTEEAQFLYYAAQEDAENTKMNIEISLQKVLQDIESGMESVKADKLATEASKKYLDASLKSYQNGVGNLTDVYLAEADYNDNRLRMINSEARIFMALSQVYYYNGTTDYGYIEEMQLKYLK